MAASSGDRAAAVAVSAYSSGAAPPSAPRNADTITDVDLSIPVMYAGPSASVSEIVADLRRRPAHVTITVVECPPLELPSLFSLHSLKQLMETIPSATEQANGFEGFSSGANIFGCAPDLGEASFTMFFHVRTEYIKEMHFLDALPTPDQGILRGMHCHFNDKVCGVGKFGLAMLMAGPESDPESTAWGHVVSWIRNNIVRVIISKRRINKQHPLIKELQKKVTITMVAFEPGQDGFFVFLGPEGRVTGDGVESLYVPTVAGAWQSWFMLPALSIRSIKKQGEEVNHCKKSVVFVHNERPNSSDESDANGEREENIRKKARCSFPSCINELDG